MIKRNIVICILLVFVTCILVACSNNQIKYINQSGIGLNSSDFDYLKIESNNVPGNYELILTPANAIGDYNVQWSDKLSKKQMTINFVCLLARVVKNNYVMYKPHFWGK